MAYLILPISVRTFLDLLVSVGYLSVSSFPEKHLGIAWSGWNAPDPWQNSRCCGFVFFCNGFPAFGEKVLPIYLRICICSKMSISVYLYLYLLVFLQWTADLLRYACICICDNQSADIGLYGNVGSLFVHLNSCFFGLFRFLVVPSGSSSGP